METQSWTADEDDRDTTFVAPALIHVHRRLLLTTFLIGFLLAFLVQQLVPRSVPARISATIMSAGDRLQPDPAYTHIILPAQVKGALTAPAALDPIVGRLDATRIGRAIDPYRIGASSPLAASDAVRRALTVVAGDRPGQLELALRSTDPALAARLLTGLVDASRTVVPAEGMEPVRLVALNAARVDAPSGSLGREIAIALLVALAAALVALAMREALEKGFTSPGTVEALTGQPVLAAVPEAAGDAAPADIVARAPASPFARAMRELAREVDLGGRTAVALCSALPGEGKTTISIALARTLARMGRQVVLVDCDGRRRALSRAFPGEPALGLVDLMAARATIADVVEQDPLSPAALIRHGATIQDFSNRTAVRSLVRDLRQRFDVVLLDTGPVLALAEARVIASVVDEVVLVARWRSTPVAATRLALKLLLAANAHMAGAALTRVWRPPTARDRTVEDSADDSAADAVQGDLHPVRVRR